MIHPFFKNNYSVNAIKHIDGDKNWFNWSFDNNVAFFRVESNYKNLAMVSEIIKFDFNIDDLNLSNQQTYLCDNNVSEDTIISFEDPRFFNGNLVYNKIFRNRSDGHIQKTRLTINHEELIGDGEKNWFFYSRNIYLYSVCPFTIFRDNEISITSFVMPELDEYVCEDNNFGLKYSISTNSFVIDGSEFIIFHTKKFDKCGLLNYSQWVLEIKDGYPFAYSKEPLFFPSKHDTDANFLNQLYDFRIISEKPFCQYNVFYAMSAHCFNNQILIAGGLNECQSVLYKINKSDFLYWFKNQKVLIND